MLRAYSLIAIKSFSDQERVITGIATTPEPDQVDDVIEPMGVEFQNPMPLLFHHDHKSPVGQVWFDQPTTNGITFKAHLPQIAEPGPLKDRVDSAYQSVKYGLIRGASIGYSAPHEYVERRKTGGLWFKKSKVHEMSLVTLPAHQSARILTVKELQSLDAEHLAALGEPRVSSPSSGVSDITRVVKTTPLRNAMKTISEQISAFEATRQAKAARMTEIMQKAADGGVTLDATQKEEYDTAAVEVKEIDAHLLRLADLEQANKTKAAPVAGADPAAAAASRGGHVISVKQQTLPPGIGFARAVKACVVARLDGRSMIDIAKQMYPSDDRLHGHISHVMNLPQIVTMIKAAVPAGTTTQADWASALVDPTNLAGEFIEFLRPATIIGKLSLRAVPFNVRMIEQTQGGNGYWVGQGAPKPLTAFGFAPVTLAFTKVAAISVITEELARFSSPSAEQLVRDGLRDALVERIDRDFIDPAEAGTANIQPASITNGLTALTSAGPTADNARTDLANIVSDFVGANQNVEGLVLIMPTALALGLSFQVNSLGQAEFPKLALNGGSINGIPVITSQYAANASGGGNLVIALNQREIFLADDGQVTIDASREASLQMLDNPTNNSATATATTMVSMWQTNSIALRAERFINWSKRRSTAVVYMDDVNWGSVGSPA